MQPPAGMSSPSHSGRSVPLVISALVLVACASSSPGARPPVTSETTPSSATVPRESGERELVVDPVVPCDLVCEQAQVVPRPADGPDHHALATRNANEVLEAMQPDLLACYAKRVAVSPKAHAFLTVDVIIGPDGAVRHVETTGGALLGSATLGCLERRIRQATFAPPHGGGTLRIHVPFALRPVTKGDDI